MLVSKKRNVAALLNAVLPRERIRQALRTLLLFVPVTLLAFFALQWWIATFGPFSNRVIGMLVVTVALAPLVVCLAQVHKIVIAFLAMALGYGASQN